MPTSPYLLRYRDPEVKEPENIETNEFIQRQLGRRSLRNYDPQRKISWEQLSYLITAAQCSPNGSGAQSWSVIALITDEEKRIFREAAGSVLDGTDPLNRLNYDNCSVFLIWIADNYKNEQGIRIVGNKELSPEELKLMPKHISATISVHPVPGRDDILFDVEQHVQNLDQSYYSIRAMQDCIIAAQTFVMCAESLGMGTLYMGSIAHCELASFKNTLNLPNKTYPLFGMCVGYELAPGSDHNGIHINNGQSDLYRKIRYSDADYADWLIKPVQPQDIVLHRAKYNKDVKASLFKYNKIIYEYVSRLKSRRANYLVSRVAQRIYKVVDQLGLMMAMGNRWR
jgi:nitroreductase